MDYQIESIEIQTHETDLEIIKHDSRISFIEAQRYITKLHECFHRRIRIA